MKKSIYPIIAIISLIMIISFYECDEIPLEISLKKNWTRSYEEETSNGIQIYRPSEYKEFPPSRYRQVIGFEENNVCRYLVLADNDAHFMEKGKWEYNEKTKIIQIYNSNSEIKYKFEVVEQTNNLLKLKYIE